MIVYQSLTEEERGDKGGDDDRLVDGIHFENVVRERGSRNVENWDTRLGRNQCEEWIISCFQCFVASCVSFPQLISHGEGHWTVTKLLAKLVRIHSTRPSLDRWRGNSRDTLWKTPPIMTHGSSCLSLLRRSVNLSIHPITRKIRLLPVYYSALTEVLVLQIDIHSQTTRTIVYAWKRFWT